MKIVGGYRKIVVEVEKEEKRVYDKTQENKRSPYAIVISVGPDCRIKPAEGSKVIVGTFAGQQVELPNGKEVLIVSDTEVGAIIE